MTLMGTSTVSAKGVSGLLDRERLLAHMMGSRVYLVTDRALAAGRREEEIVDAALAAGVGAVQLRLKQISGRDAYETARTLVSRCRRAGAPLFINDDVGLALAVGADGVHIGQDDMPATAVRRLLTPSMLLGVTAARPDLAQQAQRDGADYVGVGAMFPTTTKGNTVATGLAGIREVRAVVDVPIVAIGGISIGNVGVVMEAGADVVAIVRAIVAAADPRAASEELVRAIAAVRAR